MYACIVVNRGGIREMIYKILGCMIPVVAVEVLKNEWIVVINEADTFKFYGDMSERTAEEKALMQWFHGKIRAEANKEGG